ncbi:Fiber protein fb34 [Thalictrum thalictroides]|uniref:Fiber protein fb34 n=1 Tax=Thalictrum thalictroides TaxID=46969 RepID=A0A7J6WE39_THATH|nr:Fiber protein fb34 [Thalictrum thalictroides]
MASTILIVVILIFDLIAFGLAIAAEQRKSTAHITNDAEKNYNFCVYDSDISTGYGVGSFLFLLASQVFIMVASKCFCCGSALRPGGSRAWAIILFISCWVTFFIAEVCLLAGSVTNAYHTKYRTFYFENPPSCETVRKGVFGAGAAFIFFTAILTEFYYICYSKARNSFQAPYDTGVGMGSYS